MSSYTSIKQDNKRVPILVIPLNLVYRAPAQVLCPVLSCLSSICIRQPPPRLCRLRIFVRFSHSLHFSYPLANPQSLSAKDRKGVNTTIDRRDQQRILLPYRQALMVPFPRLLITRPR